jgi:hypothetical protein
MECTTVRWYTFCLEVVLFEGSSFPRASEGGQKLAKHCDKIATHNANISAVRSVSGLAVDKLNSGPFVTVNHWPFLNASLGPEEGH